MSLEVTSTPAPAETKQGVTTTTLQNQMTPYKLDTQYVVCYPCILKAVGVPTT